MYGQVYGVRFVRLIRYKCFPKSRRRSTWQADGTGLCRQKMELFKGNAAYTIAEVSALDREVCQRPSLVGLPHGVQERPPQ